MSRINAGTTTGTALKFTGDITGDIEFESDGVDRLVLKKDGRLYGTALHNNANPVTGATNQYVASGTYTPTLSNTTNITSSVASVCQWIRVGNVVTVSGLVNIRITTTLLQSGLGMSLPIASNFTTTDQIGGTAANIAGQETWGIYPDTANDRAFFSAKDIATTVQQVYAFSFTYLIL